MNLRTCFRRWQMGADLYDRAVASVAIASNAETAGAARAHAFIRELHAEHPNPDRRCSVPNCCEGK